MSHFEREHARVRRHLEGAWEQARSRPTALPPPIAARRASLLEHLRAYIDAGQFPVNELSDEPTPIFVDRWGSRCAVAALLDATGHSDLVEEVARTRNRARVHELVSERAFAQWLAFHGLDASEAARIQPAYHAHLEPDWRPTASVISGAYADTTESIGLEAMLLAGARLGIRRNVSGSDDNGNSEFGSWALSVEYTRAAVIGRGATNRLGLLLQWEPISNHDDAQWYVVGGPLASLDGDDQPGSGFGAELGAGFSFRRRELPLLIEIVAQGVRQPERSTAGLGLELGAVW